MYCLPTERWACTAYLQRWAYMLTFREVGMYCLERWACTAYLQKGGHICLPLERWACTAYLKRGGHVLLVEVFGEHGILVPQQAMQTHSVVLHKVFL
jgi:hypothetical protein